MQAHDDAVLGTDCRWVIGGCVAAILGLCGVIGFLARGWLKAVIDQVSDRDKRLAQMEAAKHYSAQKKGESP